MQSAIFLVVTFLQYRDDFSGITIQKNKYNEVQTNEQDF